MNLFWVIGYGYSYLRIYALSNKQKLYRFLFPALLIIYLAGKAFICISQPIVVVRYQICIPQMPIHLSGLSNGGWILLSTAEFIFYAIELYFHYRNSDGLFSILSDFRDVLYALVPLSITQITLNIVKLAIPGGTVFTTIAYAQCIIEYLFLYRSICIFSNNNTKSHGAATVNSSATKTKSNNP
ncbi:hypothetical protein BKA69DRAFT_1079131 [Paraphysoderma sedebokerense]|nr:hypothetical protein BKA69DRAFT_1079131 [Paraphysoderma sedebokerense]